MSISAHVARKFENNYIQVGIPAKREPEFGYVLENMADHITLYQALSNHPNIRITELQPPERRFLVSFAEDTVNDDGTPTREVAKLGLERRRRISLLPHGNELERFDISFKDAQKSTFRREWEVSSRCLRSGEEDILQTVSRDVPSVSTLNPESFRVSGICIASRAPYGFTHYLEKRDTAFRYHVCADACLLTNPHSDRILGYRREVEIEAKTLFLSNARDMAPERQNDLLNESLENIWRYLDGIKLIGRSAPASISKLAHANLVVQKDYERVMPNDFSSGLDWALVQNVRAWDYTFEAKREALSRLARTLPPAHLLMPDADVSALKDYFPNAHKYQPFPQ